jgi:hypothetical protein
MQWGLRLRPTAESDLMVYEESVDKVITLFIYFIIKNNNILKFLTIFTKNTLMK